ncbi:hypothetical protein Lal_00026061 [Lupinus albus]|nr:hypothetical protein Lal_00026061 [Lupinus albus]
MALLGFNSKIWDLSPTVEMFLSIGIRAFQHVSWLQTSSVSGDVGIAMFHPGLVTEASGQTACVGAGAKEWWDVWVQLQEARLGTILRLRQQTFEWEKRIHLHYD